MKKFQFDKIESFDFKIDHVISSTPLTSHVHQDCEIYVNVSGNVSFMVENRLYPVFHGNAVITKPFEFHNCIYHDDSPHEHYCINFNGSETSSYLGQFFNRKLGSNNLIVLDEEKTNELISVCFKLAETELSVVDKYYYFFNLLSILSGGEFKNNDNAKTLPEDVLIAINYINKNLTEKISLEKLADTSNVSINSLERHFVAALNMTPFTYIQKKRLAYSAKLLISGKSVLDACYDSGFTDYPHYIALFKKYYGLTPLKYKKSILK